ncbi:hypothetical protein FQN60_017866, partial [Etheostoma spectabile]
SIPQFHSPSCGEPFDGDLQASILLGGDVKKERERGKDSMEEKRQKKQRRWIKKHGGERRRKGKTSRVVDPMFMVPAPPAPGHPGAPGSSLPSAPSFSPPALPTSNPKQLVVRTRSIGTNTQDGGNSGAPEDDSACLGPCQPGTSVNLEGIVWHETEEGKECF